MTPTRKIGIGAFLLGSVVGGAIGINGFASAASDDTSTTATTVVTDDSTSATSDATDSTADLPAAPDGPHTANGITEEVLTGDPAASVQAAVATAYPDATIERLETDAEGAAYEAHVTLADGSRATIKLDAAFTVTATETGPDGHGGGHHGPNDGTEDADDDSTAASTATADA